MRTNDNNYDGNGGTGGAKGRAFTLGKGEARNDTNVVTGTFPLKGHFASVLFDTGVDRSFISESFSKSLELTPERLANPYAIELANSKPIDVTYAVSKCQLTLPGHTFTIDLMITTLGRFDIVVGMDWLSRNRAEVLYYEKSIRIPILDGDVLTVQGDKAGVVTHIISFMQAQKHLRKKNSFAFLALVTTQSQDE